MVEIVEKGNIVLMSESGKDATIIDGVNCSEHTIRITNSHKITVKGFTRVNAPRHNVSVLRSLGISIRDCDIMNAQSLFDGFGIYIESSELTSDSLYHFEFYNNRVYFNEEAGIFVMNSTPCAYNMTGNEITHNGRGIVLNEISESGVVSQIVDAVLPASLTRENRSTCIQSRYPQAHAQLALVIPVVTFVQPLQIDFLDCII
ncbi:MAG: right-handed parallel beta-helix repeat-containing protein [Candidatus Krumholzibacteria bacterium]|nr:right-handed parallel beta-helix repeat-containing protein [Candidatus Krumholzibacteria bacterium]